MLRRRSIWILTAVALATVLTLVACSKAGDTKTGAPLLVAGASGSDTTGPITRQHLASDWVKAAPVGILTAWESSAHAKNGVSCDSCHGDDPKNVVRPSAAACEECHEQAMADFNKSTHATALTHAASKAYIEKNGTKYEYKFLTYPQTGSENFGCVNCHQVGTVSAVDNSKGDCATCHSSHSFSLVEARKPEACLPCHAGPGHPQYESYVTSTHGKIYQTVSESFDFSGTTKEFNDRIKTNPLPAPVCVTCHMPNGSHDTHLGKSHDLYGARVADYDAQMDLMASRCSTCHTADKAKEWMGYADQMAQDTLKRNAEAKKLLDDAMKLGIVVKQTGNQHPIAGQLTGLEGKFFEIGMAGNRARKGAYHMNPLWAGRQGWTEQSFLYMEFKGEVDELKRIYELER